MSPFDPSEDEARAFALACRGDETSPRAMKGLLLRLDYEGRGFVGVLQSSRYVKGTLADARRGAEEDARLLSDAGFSVIRTKIEAVASNDGVPRTAMEAERSPEDRYFEFHLLVDGVNGPISEGDVASLRAIARDMSARLDRPVPLSYNALKPAQRFLNLRARGCGLDDAMTVVNDLSERIEATDVLRVVKVIGEYICHDDNRAVDAGWLEPA